MVVLVLADNLLLMYLGWEGVGLCSYLLIGFYYTDPKNGAAAMKAFVVTRVGDVFLAFALFILYNELGTLNFREMVELAPQHSLTAAPRCSGRRCCLAARSVNPPSCRCKRGLPMRWRVRRRSLR